MAWLTLVKGVARRAHPVTSTPWSIDVLPSVMFETQLCSLELPAELVVTQDPVPVKAS